MSVAFGVATRGHGRRPRAAVFAELLSAGLAVAQRAPHTKAALRAFAERHLEGPNAIWIDPALHEEYERAVR